MQNQVTESIDYMLADITNVESKAYLRPMLKTALEQQGFSEVDIEEGLNARLSPKTLQ